MFVLAEGTAPVVDPGTAGGVFSLLWLVIALPALGALILLVGGPLAKGRLDKHGHLLGTAMPVLSFLISVAMFVTMLGRSSDDRQVSQHLFTWFEAGSLNVPFDLLYDPLSSLFLLLITGVGLADLHLLDRLHGARPPSYPLLRLPQPLRRGDADAGAVGQLPRPVPRLGGRRSRVLPADRLLAVQALGGGGGQEGLHRQPGRRHRPLAGHRAVLHDVRYDRLHHDQCRGAERLRGHHDRARAAPAARRLRQVGPGAAAVLAARRHGGPDARLGADPRGDDGDGRGLPDRPVQLRLRLRARRPHGRGDRRHRDPALRRDHRMREGRHQEGARRLDHEPDRLHDARRRHRDRGLPVRDLPPAEPRLLQGRHVPRRRLGDARHGRRRRHAPLRHAPQGRCR